MKSICRNRFTPRTPLEICPRCGTCAPKFVVDADNGWLRCSNISSEVPFDYCRFEAPQPLCRLPFVRVTASGLPAFGQTVWNAVTHHRMWALGGVADTLFLRLPYFAGIVDSLVEDILDHGQLAPATISSMFPPDTHGTLACHQSRIRGKNEFVLLVEDCPGEWVLRLGVEDLARQHLLDSDALILFIDPTRQPEEWLPEMRRFFHDLQARRATRVGRPINVPVALVVPKLDLLVDEEHFPKTDAAMANRLIRGRALLQNSGPMNEHTTLPAIERRGRILCDMVNGHMPLSHLIKMVEAIVGRGRVMAFPVATFGWPESPLEPLKHLRAVDRKTAERWLIANSFGVIDPLLWLLHQLGLQTLPTK